MILGSPPLSHSAGPQAMTDAGPGPELEARFRQILERLCSEEPEHRFDEAAEVLQALESVVLPASELDSGVTAQPVEPWLVSGVRRSAPARGDCSGFLGVGGFRDWMVPLVP